MIGLMKLELRKHSLKWPLIAIGLTNVLLLVIMYFVLKNDDFDFDGMFFIADNLILVVACVTSSGLFNAYIIDSIQTGEFQYLNQYGISRVTFFYAKLLLIILLAWSLSIVTFLILYTGTIYIHQGYEMFLSSWSYLISIMNLYHILGICLSYVFIGLAPGYMALRLNSKVLMITASWLISLALNSLGENMLGGWYGREIIFLAFIYYLSFFMIQTYIDSNKV